MTADTTLKRSRILILSFLLLLSALAWGMIVWQASSNPSEDGMGVMGASLTLGMSGLLFMGMWVLMMVAMMFPTAAPMILMFAQVSRNRQERGQAHVPTWFFVSAYLVVWAAFGVAAYLVAAGLDNLLSQTMFLSDNAARIAGAALILAGIYQLSPLKNMCLTKCRTPLSFVMTSWKEGYGGAFRMGLIHGSYCLGCCWLLFVLLFPLGVMNVAAMGLVTLLIFIEKSVRHGNQIGKAVGLGMAAYGLAALFIPTILPTSL